MISKAHGFIITAICLFTVISCTGIKEPAAILYKNNIKINHDVNNVGLIISTPDKTLARDNKLIPQIENLFKFYLNKQGFLITETNKYISIEDEIKQNYLPFYDHKDGHFFNKKHSDFKAKALNIYRDTYQLDIILKVDITMQNIKVSSSKAEWHNVYQKYSQRNETMFEYIPAYSLSTKYIYNNQVTQSNIYGLTLKEDGISFDLAKAGNYEAVIEEIIKPLSNNH